MGGAAARMVAAEVKPLLGPSVPIVPVQTTWPYSYYLSDLASCLRGVSQFTIVQEGKENSLKIRKILQRNRGRNLGRGWDGSAKICLRWYSFAKKEIVLPFLHF